MRLVRLAILCGVSCLLSLSSFAIQCDKSAFELSTINIKDVSYALDPLIALNNFVKDPKSPLIQVKTTDLEAIKMDAVELAFPQYILDRMQTVVKLWLDIRPKKASSWLDSNATWLDRRPEKVMEIDRLLYEKVLEIVDFVAVDVSTKKVSIEETRFQAIQILDSLFGNYRNESDFMTTHQFLMILIHNTITDKRPTSYKPSYQVEEKFKKSQVEELEFTNTELELALRMMMDRKG